MYVDKIILIQRTVCFYQKIYCVLVLYCYTKLFYRCIVSSTRSYLSLPAGPERCNTQQYAEFDQ